MLGNIGGDFTFVFLGDNAEFFELFGGGIDRGAVLVDSLSDFRGSALAVLNKEEIDFGLDLGEPSLS